MAHIWRKAVIGLGFVGVFAIGWYVGRMPAGQTGSAYALPVRESGYEFTNPLLTCSRDSTAALDDKAQKVIETAVNAEIQKNDISTASVYYRKFLDNSWALTNGDEEYYPASLNKVPLMMAYYALSEGTNFPLTRDLKIPAGLNENAQQEIPPSHPLEAGKSYTASQLIEAMAEDSDNNATLALLNDIDVSSLKKVFSDLAVPFLAPGEPPGNYMSVNNYAYFFRVLYNGTYISHDDSEKALQILSQSTFKDGLVAGVPPGTTVAHKFGLVSVSPTNNVVTARELHDCGIVYPADKQPYLLCVMTKSTGSLQNAELAIANISRAVYQYANP